MTKILSQEEIDSLLTSVSNGDDADIQTKRGGSKVSLYDFKRPNLISKDQMRLLENIHEGLARNFGVYLSAQLRMIVDMNLLAIDQIMYSEFVMSIVSPGAIYVGDFSGPKSKFVLEVSPQLVVFIVERLFGGKGHLIPMVRPISVIEQRIMSRVVERIAYEISKNWEQLKQFDTVVNRFESNPEFVQIVSASEPVIVVSMEAKIHNNTSMLNICYPYRWISSILSSPENQEKVLFGAREGTDKEKYTLMKSVSVTPVSLRAVLGKGKISINDFMELNKGDVILLDGRTREKVSVFAENRLVYTGSVGQSNQNNAIRIHNVITGDEGHEKRRLQHKIK
ncbi:MAG: flagellar motor switch protein FliM [Candidatus Marinimicrobia bacterium]|nr:flagellar motor switch protein FliM [Candidatus Neomarinimicrobiota bacterium]